MVYQLDTPGLEDQAVTNDKIESGTIEINRLDSTLAGALVPVGGIIMWSGTLDQINGFPNWQLCDGSAIASGTLSGTNTPNLTGRFVIGTNTYDTGDGRWEETITGSANQTGGSKDAILVSHSHTVNDHNHTFTGGTDNNTHNHGVRVGTAGGGGGGYVSDKDSQAPGSNGPDTVSIQNNTHSHSVSGSTNNAGNLGTSTQGSVGTNQNLPPYYALAYIIRIN